MKKNDLNEKNDNNLFIDKLLKDNKIIKIEKKVDCFAFELNIILDVKEDKLIETLDILQNNIILFNITKGYTYNIFLFEKFKKTKNDKKIFYHKLLYINEIDIIKLNNIVQFLKKNFNFILFMNFIKIKNQQAYKFKTLNIK